LLFLLFFKNYKNNEYIYYKHLNDKFPLGYVRQKQNYDSSSLIGYREMEWDDSLGGFDDYYEAMESVSTVSVSREDEATQPDRVNWNQLGLACQTEDELNKAIEFHEKALFTYISLGRKEDEAATYGNLGLVYQSQGNLNKAIEFHKKALFAYVSLDMKEYVAAAYGNLGLVYQSQGNLDKAIEFHEKALRLDEAIGNKAGMAEDYRNLGLVYEVQGKLNIAIQFHQRALKLNEILDRKNGMAQNYGNLALIYQKQGNNIEAKKNYKMSIAIYKQVGSPTAETMQTLLNALR